jgi:hypothetical protein
MSIYPEWDPGIHTLTEAEAATLRGLREGELVAVPRKIIDRFPGIDPHPSVHKMKIEAQDAVRLIAAQYPGRLPAGVLTTDWFCLIAAARRVAGQGMNELRCILEPYPGLSDVVLCVTCGQTRDARAAASFQTPWPSCPINRATPAAAEGGEA